LAAKALGPLERGTLAGPFLQSLVIGGNGLFELRRPPLALPMRLAGLALEVLEVAQPQRLTRVLPKPA
jgi:hypothetical protein